GVFAAIGLGTARSNDPELERSNHDAVTPAPSALVTRAPTPASSNAPRVGSYREMNVMFSDRAVVSAKRSDSEKSLSSSGNGTSRVTNIGWAHGRFSWAVTGAETTNGPHIRSPSTSRVGVLPPHVRRDAHGVPLIEGAPEEIQAECAGLFARAIDR